MTQQELQLLNAAITGNTTLIEKSLKEGVNCNGKDSKGATALHHATSRQFKTIVHLLLSHGANIHEKSNSGQTPLQLAELHPNKALAHFIKSWDDYNLSIAAFQQNNLTEAEKFLAIATTESEQAKQLDNNFPEINHIKAKIACQYSEIFYKKSCDAFKQEQFLIALTSIMEAAQKLEQANAFDPNITSSSKKLLKLKEDIEIKKQEINARLYLTEGRKLYLEGANQYQQQFYQDALISFEKALTAYQTAAKITPTKNEAEKNISLCVQEIKKCEAELTRLKYDHFIKSAEKYFSQGEGFFIDKQYLVAIECFHYALKELEEAEQINPSSEKISDLKNRINNKLKLAENEAENPEAIQLFGKGVSFIRQYQYHEAIKCFEQIQQKHPDSFKSEVAYNLAVLKVEITRPVERYVGAPTAYPLHYEYALFSQQAYEPKGGNVSALIDNWSLYATSEDLNLKDDKGFFAAAYINRMEKRVIIAYRGSTKDIKNILTDMRLFFLEKDIAYGLAYAFSQYVDEKILLEKNPQEFTVSYAGHSLGATIAIVIASEHDRAAVVFDDPGAKPLLTKDIPNNSLQIITYLSEPNILNTVNAHVGTVYRIYPFIHILKKLELLTAKELSKNYIPSYIPYIPKIGKYVEKAIDGVDKYIVAPLYRFTLPMANRTWCLHHIDNIFMVFALEKLSGNRKRQEKVLSFPKGIIQCEQFYKVLEENPQSVANYNTIKLPQHRYVIEKVACYRIQPEETKTSTSLTPQKCSAIIPQPYPKNNAYKRLSTLASQLSALFPESKERETENTQISTQQKMITQN